MLEKHSSSRQGHGKVLSCLHGLFSVTVVKNTIAWGGKYGEGKELVESIFIKVEPGIAVLGSCCVSSAWSSHNVGGSCAWFVLEQPRTEARGAVDVSGTPEPAPGWMSHPSSQMTAWAMPCSLIPTTVSISELQKWQISPQKCHLGSDDVLPVVLSHHHLLFV